MGPFQFEKIKDQLVSFGDYQVNLRFFRKPNTKLKSIWDTSVIGIEILP